ncbi:tetratricopeptide repeat protein [Marinobacterium lutimaris]|uniref:Tetratricopeptide repeat-containing protein n=1 Tax=Marinobacterium lutimaris TaxID=568106 RepID=A0A1H5XHF3_9GAMM|nr:tetratricopeptide repeat protein [Marinobacterium lutimaris]SEG11188.1 Tetratricopeptide repeat-containing protein [Marinobacterium lutimaris]
MNQNHQAAAAEAHAYHLGVAEAGKCFALKGDHREALRHYREAMRLAVSASAPEVFFRHYCQCVLESLELTGQFQEVIEYCEKADAYYEQISSQKQAPSQLHGRDHASILERLGLIYAKQGESEAAIACLEKARTLAGSERLALTEQVYGWLRRGMVPDVARLTAAQRKHQYFTVRAEQVDARRARPLTADQGSKHHRGVNPFNISD